MTGAMAGVRDRTSDPACGAEGGCGALCRLPRVAAGAHRGRAERLCRQRARLRAEGGPPAPAQLRCACPLPEGRHARGPRQALAAAPPARAPVRPVPAGGRAEAPGPRDRGDAGAARPGFPRARSEHAGRLHGARQSGDTPCRGAAGRRFRPCGPRPGRTSRAGLPPSPWGSGARRTGGVGAIPVTGTRGGGRCGALRAGRPGLAASWAGGNPAAAGRRQRKGKGAA
jgi:hypothetical protein